MPVTVIVDVPVKPELLEATIAKFHEVLPATRAFEGCLEVDLLQRQDDPNRVVLVEKWESRSDHELYMAWRKESKTGVLHPDVVAGPVDMIYLDPVK